MTCHTSEKVLYGNSSTKLIAREKALNSPFNHSQEKVMF
jgi:hypothetical protein